MKPKNKVSLDPKWMGPEQRLLPKEPLKVKGSLDQNQNSIPNILFEKDNDHPNPDKNDHEVQISPKVNSDEVKGQPTLKKVHEPQQHEGKIPLFITFLSWFGLTCLALLAFISHCSGLRVKVEKNRKGYTPLYNTWETFYKFHLLRRVWSGMFSPIRSAPGPIVSVMTRISNNKGWTIQNTNESKDCINIGSYNYLGLSHKDSPCNEVTIAELHKFGVGTCAPRVTCGTSVIHERLETQLAKFLGVEETLVFGMGFATNSLNLPALISQDTLVLSDQFNHASIILGLKGSGGNVRVFNHNDMNDLEIQLRRGILEGIRERERPWDKILIVVEGVYSMHGSIAILDEIVKLKKKYGAYLYLDEAHCIGALGENGRGVTQYFGVDPKDIDIMMGTFAKAFGAVGGYIGGSSALIQFLKRSSGAHVVGTAIPPVIAAFICEGLRILSGEAEGTWRLRQLQRNTRYFRRRMRQMRFVLHGDEDSPVVPVVTPSPALSYIVDFMRERGVAAVMVSYPATPITEGRIRCCMSALHTKSMLDHILQCFEEVSNNCLGLRVLNGSGSEEGHKIVEY